MNNYHDTSNQFKKKYDLVVYIGRFEPFHLAHEATIRRAESMGENVLVLIGSASTAQSPKNPWDYIDRESIIQYEFPGIFIEPVNDVQPNSLWIQSIGDIIESYKEDMCIEKIAIIGHDKDDSSFYLNFFPQWDYIEMPAYPDHGETIDSTKIRELMFRGDYHFIKGVVSDLQYNRIIEFTHTQDFKVLKNDYDATQAYIESWKPAPFDPTFITVDSVVVQSGHVLLIQRGNELGYGLWAMPGGFIERNEFLRDASVRELREETKLKVPEIILSKSISDKDTEVFDDPFRSSRGRTVTHAFLFILDDTQKLPKVKGSDDAMDAKWVSFSDFANMQDQMFEDHFHIISKMISKV